MTSRERRTQAKLTAALAHQEAGRLDEAERLFRQILAVYPDHQRALDYLGGLLVPQYRLAEALPCFLKLLTFVSNSWVHENLSFIYDRLRQPKKALEHIRQSAVLHPHPFMGRMSLARTLLINGDLAEGFGEMAACFNNGHPFPRLPNQLRGETVVIDFHQVGFGDAIMLARYMPLIAARGAWVVAYVPEALRHLFKSVPGVSEVISKEFWLGPPRLFRVPVLALPATLGTPAIIPDGVCVRGNPVAWRDFLVSLPGLKVGLCWAGRHGDSEAYNQTDDHRSMRLAGMAPLFSVPGCSFVSLQLGPPAAQLADLPPGVVHDVSARLGDWQATADLVSGLDLVIAVDTAVCHLAGALGKSIWMLNKAISCWRWLHDRSDTDWYPSMRLFQQAAPGDWSDVIAEAVRELADLSEQTALSAAA